MRSHLKSRHELVWYEISGGEGTSKTQKITKYINTNNHVKSTHSTDRPYKCSHCKKDFRDVKGLKTHIITHTEEKPYECTECGKCFTQLSNILKHFRMHTVVHPPMS